MRTGDIDLVVSRFRLESLNETSHSERRKGDQNPSEMFKEHLNKHPDDKCARKLSEGIPDLRVEGEIETGMTVKTQIEGMRAHTSFVAHYLPFFPQVSLRAEKDTRTLADCRVAA